MDPTLSKGQSWRQPPLIGAHPGAKINDLHVVIKIAVGGDQVVDQLWEQSRYSGGASGGVGGDSGGEPAGVGGWCCGRSR